MNDLTWVSISLFCNRSIAHHVLKQSIHPFITQCAKNNFLESWFFEFNTMLGENIRLSLLVPFGQAANVAINAKGHFTLFFEHLNFPQTHLSFPLNGIFLPFPENSIQFGLYNVTTQGEQIAPDLVQKISKVLLEALGENKIDEETVLTLSLYLHLALKKKVLNLSLNNELLLKSFYETAEASTVNPSTLAFFQEKLEDNETVIKGICDDIYDAGFYKDHAWLVLWADLCEEAINKGDFLGNIQRLIHLLNKQLGISFSQDPLVRYLVLSTWNL